MTYGPQASVPFSTRELLACDRFLRGRIHDWTVYKRSYRSPGPHHEANQLLDASRRTTAAILMHVLTKDVDAVEQAVQEGEKGYFFSRMYGEIMYLLWWVDGWYPAQTHAAAHDVLPEGKVRLRLRGFRKYFDREVSTGDAKLRRQLVLLNAEERLTPGTFPVQGDYVKVLLVDDFEAVFFLRPGGFRAGGDGGEEEEALWCPVGVVQGSLAVKDSAVVLVHFLCCSEVVRVSNTHLVGISQREYQTYHDRIMAARSEGLSAVERVLSQQEPQLIVRRACHVSGEHCLASFWDHCTHLQLRLFNTRLSRKLCVVLDDGVVRGLGLMPSQPEGGGEGRIRDLDLGDKEALCHRLIEHMAVSKGRMYVRGVQQPEPDDKPLLRQVRGVLSGTPVEVGFEGEDRDHIRLWVTHLVGPDSDSQASCRTYHMGPLTLAQWRSLGFPDLDWLTAQDREQLCGELLRRLRPCQGFPVLVMDDGSVLLPHDFQPFDTSKDYSQASTALVGEQGYQQVQEGGSCATIPEGRGFVFRRVQRLDVYEEDEEVEQRAEPRASEKRTGDDGPAAASGEERRESLGDKGPGQTGQSEGLAEVVTADRQPDGEGRQASPTTTTGESPSRLEDSVMASQEKQRRGSAEAAGAATAVEEQVPGPGGGDGPLQAAAGTEDKQDGGSREAASSEQEQRHVEDGQSAAPATADEQGAGDAVGSPLPAKTDDQSKAGGVQPGDGGEATAAGGNGPVQQPAAAAAAEEGDARAEATADQPLNQPEPELSSSTGTAGKEAEEEERPGTQQLEQGHEGDDGTSAKPRLADEQVEEERGVQPKQLREGREQPSGGVATGGDHRLTEPPTPGKEESEKGDGRAALPSKQQRASASAEPAESVPAAPVTRRRYVITARLLSDGTLQVHAQSPRPAAGEPLRLSLSCADWHAALHYGPLLWANRAQQQFVVALLCERLSVRGGRLCFEPCPVLGLRTHGPDASPLPHPVLVRDHGHQFRVSCGGEEVLLRSDDVLPATGIAVQYLQWVALPLRRHLCARLALLAGRRSDEAGGVGLVVENGPILVWKAVQRKIREGLGPLMVSVWDLGSDLEVVYRDYSGAVVERARTPLRRFQELVGRELWPLGMADDTKEVALRHLIRCVGGRNRLSRFSRFRSLRSREDEERLAQLKYVKHMVLTSEHDVVEHIKRIRPDPNRLPPRDVEFLQRLIFSINETEKTTKAGDRRKRVEKVRVKLGSRRVQSLFHKEPPVRPVCECCYQECEPQHHGSTTCTHEYAVCKVCLIQARTRIITNKLPSVRMRVADLLRKKRSQLPPVKLPPAEMNRRRREVVRWLMAREEARQAARKSLVSPLRHIYVGVEMPPRKAKPHKGKGRRSKSPHHHHHHQQQQRQAGGVSFMDKSTHFSGMMGRFGSGSGVSSPVSSLGDPDSWSVASAAAASEHHDDDEEEEGQKEKQDGDETEEEEDDDETDEPEVHDDDEEEKENGSPEEGLALPSIGETDEEEEDEGEAVSRLVVPSGRRVMAKTGRRVMLAAALEDEDEDEDEEAEQQQQRQPVREEVRQLLNELVATATHKAATGSRSPIAVAGSGGITSRPTLLDTRAVVSWTVRPLMTMSSGEEARRTEVLQAVQQLFRTMLASKGTEDRPHPPPPTVAVEEATVALLENTALPLPPSLTTALTSRRTGPAPPATQQLAAEGGEETGGWQMWEELYYLLREEVFDVLDEVAVSVEARAAEAGAEEREARLQVLELDVDQLIYHGHAPTRFVPAATWVQTRRGATAREREERRQRLRVMAATDGADGAADHHQQQQQQQQQQEDAGRRASLLRQRLSEHLTLATEYYHGQGTEADDYQQQQQYYHHYGQEGYTGAATDQQAGEWDHHQQQPQYYYDGQAYYYQDENGAWQPYDQQGQYHEAGTAAASAETGEVESAAVDGQPPQQQEEEEGGGAYYPEQDQYSYDYGGGQDAAQHGDAGAGSTSYGEQQQQQDVGYEGYAAEETAAAEAPVVDEQQQYDSYYYGQQAVDGQGAYDYGQYYEHGAAAAEAWAAQEGAGQQQQQQQWQEGQGAEAYQAGGDEAGQEGGDYAAAPPPAEWQAPEGQETPYGAAWEEAGGDASAWQPPQQQDDQYYQQQQQQQTGGYYDADGVWHDDEAAAAQWQVVEVEYVECNLCGREVDGQWEARAECQVCADYDLCMSCHDYYLTLPPDSIAVGEHRPDHPVHFHYPPTTAATSGGEEEEGGQGEWQGQAAEAWQGQEAEAYEEWQGQPDGTEWPDQGADAGWEEGQGQQGWDGQQAAAEGWEGQEAGAYQGGGQAWQGQESEAGSQWQQEQYAEANADPQWGQEAYHGPSA